MQEDRQDYETLATFRYALRQFLRFSEEAAATAGATPQQHQALLAIAGFPGRAHVTVGELAERLQVRHHSAVGLVNRLCALNLVERRPAAADRRQVYIHLTADGWALLDRLADVHRRQLKELGPVLLQLIDSLHDAP